MPQVPIESAVLAGAAAAAAAAAAAVTKRARDLPFESEDIYNRRGQGLCLIINNKRFKTANGDAMPGLKERVGTEHDEERLRTIFQRLNYDVKVYNDVSAAAMLATARSKAKEDLSSYGALIFVVLSHGAKDVVYGSDSIPLPIKDLQEPFESYNCKSLNGKPKVFIIQACQGDGIEQVESDGAGAGQGQTTPANSKVIDVRYRPKDADFFIGLATVEGKESYRLPDGSWFIKELCKNIESYAFNDREHFYDIFRMTNRDVSERVGQKEHEGRQAVVRQTPQGKVTLAKHFYLRRVLRGE